MLSRVLEPEAMDSPEEAREYDGMDHSEVNRRFASDLLAAGAAGDMLDLGTGTAQIPIEVLRQEAEGRIMAADVAAAMLEVAHYNVHVAGFPDRIQLDLIDAKALHYRDGMFDVVMSNSLVHHLPDPFPALQEAVRVTRPGGLLFFRDLARPETAEELESLVTQYAGNESEPARRMFAESLRAALRLEEIQQLLADLGFPPESVELTSDRHWTWSARKPE